jgi:ribonuclease BN (tRNA processing enzyme)
MRENCQNINIYHLSFTIEQLLKYFHDKCLMINDNMNLTVLGSGCSWNTAHRASAGYWLETIGGSLVLDISAAVPFRAAQENLDWANLDAIWVSHFHLDHCGGLWPFLFGTKYTPETQNRTKSLKIFGGAGLNDLLKALDLAGDYGLMKQPFPVEIIEVTPGQEFDLLPNVAAKTFSTPHTLESMAIRLTDSAGKSFVYTSDTGFDVSLGEFAYNADLFLVECSYCLEKAYELHLNLAEVVELVRLANPRETMIGHLYPEWDILPSIPEFIESYCPVSRIIAAADGLKHSIGG